MVSTDHFQKQALKARSDHIEKYVKTVFQRDYLIYVKSGTRYDHTKFSSLVKEVLNKKLTEDEVKKALKDKADEDKKTKGIFGMFG